MMGGVVMEAADENVEADRAAQQFAQKEEGLVAGNADAGDDEDDEWLNKEEEFSNGSMLAVEVVIVELQLESEFVEDMLEVGREEIEEPL